MTNDKTKEQKAEAFKKQLFDELVSKLAERNFTSCEAADFTTMFYIDLNCLTQRALEPVRRELRRMCLPVYLEKEAQIKKLFDQVLLDLRLLTGQDACEAHRTE